MIEFTMALERRYDTEGEDDGLTAEATQPVMIDPADVREFYTRKHGLVGTRIVFHNGAARPVKETYQQVKEAFAAAARVN